MNKRAFTFIELTIVVALLAVLTSLVVIGMGNSRRNARDGRRLSDASVLESAVTQYSLFKGNTFITVGACTVIVVPGGLSHGSGDGCTGADGTAFGKVNLRSAQVQTVVGTRLYTPHSIADGLKAAGYLASEALDPFNGDRSHTDASQPDYLLVRCCQNAKQTLLSTGSAFAVWATLERTPTPVEVSNTSQFCGSRSLQPGANQVYDMGIAESERPNVEAHGVARGNVGLQKISQATLPCNCTAVATVALPQ